ncbi:MAG: helix-turn-helix domain-containing protein [Pirellulales bacterium]|nr:helix-turn-helix domain-containing protein [Pirellulales bacterium]
MDELEPVAPATDVRMPDIFLTVRDVAARLRVSQSCVYALVQQGRLSCHRIGGGRGAVRISESDLQRFLISCRAESAEPTEPQREEPRRAPRVQLKHLKL